MILDQKAWGKGGTGRRHRRKGGGFMTPLCPQKAAGGAKNLSRVDILLIS